MKAALITFSIFVIMVSVVSTLAMRVSFQPSELISTPAYDTTAYNSEPLANIPLHSTSDRYASAGEVFIPPITNSIDMAEYAVQLTPEIAANYTYPQNSQQPQMGALSMNEINGLSPAAGN